jgi:uncharacterized membrane protein YjjP (DUF1212 family)
MTRDLQLAKRIRGDRFWMILLIIVLSCSLFTLSNNFRSILSSFFFVFFIFLLRKLPQNFEFSYLICLIWMIAKSLHDDYL